MSIIAHFQDVSNISKRNYEDPETNEGTHIYTFKGRQPLSPQAFENLFKPIDPQVKIACGVKRDGNVWTVQVQSHLNLDKVIFE